MTKKVEVKVDNEVNEKVAKARQAYTEFLSLNQEEVDFIVAKASVAGVDQHGYLAQVAIEETGRGVFEDKATKNMFACEHVINHMRNLKTVGIISDDDVTGVTEIADPVGVICAMTPVTNPTSTAMFKALIALKTRNPIIFSFHPSAQRCSVEAAKVIRDAAVAAGAPKDCIQWIEKGSKEKTDELMNHEDVATILATGGNAMVRAAYSCGKPALGVGAGNVPAYIEKTADVAQAVNDIALSKGFDNGMICASEQACIVDKEIYKEVVDRFKNYGVHFINKDEKAKLEKFMFGVASTDKNYADAVLNPNIVGKDATWIAEQAGIKVPSNTVILAAECAEVGPKEVLTREKLSPVLAFLKSKSTDNGIELARQMVEFNGLGHSAAIHTKSKEISERFGEAIPAIRIIWNSPSTFGGIGNVYNDFIPSLTLGCGSYGHNSVGDNVGAVHLLNIKKVGRRNNNMQWFKVPQRIYFERNSIRYLSEMKDVQKVFVVTDKAMVDLGFYSLIVEQLNARSNRVDIQVFADVEPDPSIETVERGVEMMRAFQPDTIIALGGGSPMDAAKGMWIFYEHPDTDFNDLKQKFIDIRKRAFKYPELGSKAQMVCIPTTSGTGSEVTPFAVITDKKANKKYPLADYSMVPNVAIVDPIFTTNLPSSVTADTGMDVLTHATEAYVSNFANDYTDGLCIQAIKLVFQNLELCVHDGSNELEAREKMHNASTMAGMAFGNAFLGMNHSMAHKFGGRFHVPHGRINAILMPYVIRYNGTHPEKPSLWPKYNVYRAHERYAELARILGLPANTVEEGVESYAQACHDLAVRCGIEMSFKAQGVDEKEFLKHEKELAYLAYEDQCSPCNPRLPMVEDMRTIFKKAYYGE
ncbi:bifunctional acetaldehyde-CoA/alcohol dehydrogenase [Erysipelothrix urinaevulpis]|uniref:bifunctional acetaldehyde-CoA/alcohol dehydrogenase n=1 Tax=Erysipelothrix urinaevulpis TaxID=2683717 RepID=UPI00135BE55F|nr:bifunctional acetaldehyde-CoA/alcohol dehydrogenase [Erysipelothrix urinaevulpis]